MDPPRRESPNQPIQLPFNRFLRVDFQGSRVTSDGGLLVVREPDERLDQDRRTAGETCALLTAAAGRRASHAGAFWQHAAKDRGAAAAERVANQEKQRIERSEVIPRGQVSAVPLCGIGGENQTKPACGTAKRAARPPTAAMSI